MIKCKSTDLSNLAMEILNSSGPKYNFKVSHFTGINSNPSTLCTVFNVMILITEINNAGRYHRIDQSNPALKR